jgi:hypothetical protein
VAAADGPFGALSFASNVQHYQHLLGYELLHMIPETGRPIRQKWRRLTSIIAAAAAIGTLLVVPVADGTTGSANRPSGATWTTPPPVRVAPAGCSPPGRGQQLPRPHPTRAPSRACARAAILGTRE